MRISTEQALSIHRLCELHGAVAADLEYDKNLPSHPRWTVKFHDARYVIGDTGRVIEQEVISRAF